MPTYLASIGMEVHSELLTESKMFCRCPVAFGGEPNTRVCPVCLGLPGALPVPNKLAVEFVIKTALALNCQIATTSIFHRKNYFYPDLPKGYQISQYGETNPIGFNGYLEIQKEDGSLKRIRIRRVHLEEDTGKLIHLSEGGSGVDYNRSGLPLMEIVTEFPPDIENEYEAKEYLVQLRKVLLYLGVCDGKMEEGSLRCEPNVSVRPEGADRLGVKSELKNLGSFKAVQLGVRFEVDRQSTALEKGKQLQQETRGWNEQRQESYLMRTKEEENDYRYFPDPDLVSMVFEGQYVEGLRDSLPELPLAKSLRYQREYGFSRLEAEEISDDREWSAFFEELVDQGANPSQASNWMRGKFRSLLNDAGLSVRQSKVTSNHLAELIRLVAEETINRNTGQDILLEMFDSGRMPEEIVREKGLTQVIDKSSILPVVAKVLAENAELVTKYKSGVQNIKGYLVGQVMREMGGKANPKLVNDALGEALDQQ